MNEQQLKQLYIECIDEVKIYAKKNDLTFSDTTNNWLPGMGPLEPSMTCKISSKTNEVIYTFTPHNILVGHRRVPTPLDWNPQTTYSNPMNYNRFLHLIRASNK